jgi:hypothetical protein
MPDNAVAVASASSPLGLVSKNTNPILGINIRLRVTIRINSEEKRPIKQRVEQTTYALGFGRTLFLNRLHFEEVIPSKVVNRS